VEAAVYVSMAGISIDARRAEGAVLSHGRRNITARCGGKGICEHGKTKRYCKSAKAAVYVSISDRGRSKLERWVNVYDT
jgi:hypothetical protein